MLALAPVGLALIPLLLLAQNPGALAAAWRDSGNLLSRNATALASPFRDPADVLAERSPGTRDPNALYSIKPDRIAPLADLASVLPHERVLSVVRDRPGTDPFPSAASLFPDDPLAFGTPDLTSLAPSGAFPGTGGGGGGSPGSGGSGGFVPGRSTDTIVPPAVVDVPSAVPEPSTWLMNIVGFFAIAAVLRRRRLAPRNMALGLT